MDVTVNVPEKNAQTPSKKKATSSGKNKKYYKTFLEVSRTSGRTDNITIMVSEDFVAEEILSLEAGSNIMVTGTVSSFFEKRRRSQKVKSICFSKKN